MHVLNVVPASRLSPAVTPQLDMEEGDLDRALPLMDLGVDSFVIPQLIGELDQRRP